MNFVDFINMNEAMSAEDWVGETVAVLSKDKKSVVYIGEVIRTQKNFIVIKPNKNTAVAKRQPELVVDPKEVVFANDVF